MQSQLEIHFTVPADSREARLADFMEIQLLLGCYHNSLRIRASSRSFPTSKKIKIIAG